MLRRTVRSPSRICWISTNPETPFCAKKLDLRVTLLWPNENIINNATRPSTDDSEASKACPEYQKYLYSSSCRPRKNFPLRQPPLFEWNHLRKISRQNKVP